MEEDAVQLVHHLAESLSLSLNPMWHHVHRIISTMPHGSVLEEIDGKNETTESLETLKAVICNKVNQECLLALVLFFRKSGGKFADKVCPIFLRTLDILSQCVQETAWIRISNPKKEKFITIYDLTQEEQSLHDFLLAFVSELALAAASPKADTEIARKMVESIHRLLMASLKKESYIVTVSILSSIAQVQCVPFTKEEVLTMVKRLRPVISFTVNVKQSKLKSSSPHPSLSSPTADALGALSLYALKKSVLDALEPVASVTGKEEVDEIQGLASDTFELTKAGPSPSDVLASAVQLVTRCALAQPSLGKMCKEMLESLLHGTVEAVVRLDEHTLQLCKALLHGIGKLASASSHTVPRTVEFLHTLLLETLPNIGKGLGSSLYTSLRDKAIDTLCVALRTEREVNGIESLRSIMHLLANRLYSVHNDYVVIRSQSKDNHHRSASMQSDTVLDAQRVEAILATTIRMLGRVSVTQSSVEVAEIVTPVLISRISTPPLPMDVTLIEQLTEIALTGSKGVSYTPVVDLLVNMYRNVLNKNSDRGNTIPNAFLRLAHGLASNELREDLLERLMRLIQQLGHHIQRSTTKTRKASSMAGVIGMLLPSIAHLLHSIDLISPNTQQLKMFRHLMFYCVMYGFVSDDAWRGQEWHDATRRIAARIPPLVAVDLREKTHYYIETELEIESFLHHGISSQDLNVLRGELSQAVTAHAKAIHSYSFAQCMYLLSMYHLEMLRAEHAVSFQGVFAYVEDRGISESAIAPCVRGIADRVFPAFLDAMEAKEKTKARDELLESHTTFLLLKYCHREANVRKAADEYIVMLLARFPQILWSRKSLRTLLDLFEMIGKACEERPPQLVQRIYGVILSDEVAPRKELLQSVFNLCAVWFRTALKLAPVSTSSLLQEYLRSFDELHRSFLKHAGYALASEIGGFTKDSLLALGSGRKGSSGVTAARSVDDFVHSNSSLFVNELQIKAIHTGEVRALLNMGRIPDAELAQAIMDQLSNSEWLSDERSTAMSPDFHAYLYRATALLVELSKRAPLVSSGLTPRAAQQTNHDTLMRKLLRIIVRLPVKYFTQDALSTAVVLWDWVLASSPTLVLPLMAEIRDAWMYTVDNTMGIYSNEKRRHSPLEIDRHEAVMDRFTDPTPHVIWMHFLGERLIVVKQSDRDEMNIFISILLKSVSNPRALSILPKAFAPRFRLLLLCMDFLHECKDAVEHSLASILRDRVYMCSLAWFEHNAIWYDPGSREDLLDDVRVIIRFLERLGADAARLRKSLRERVDQPHPSLYGSYYHEAYESLGSTRSLNIYATSRYRRATNARAELPQRNVSSLKDQVQELNRRRKMIALLLGNALDRISIWHNPMNIISLMVLRTSSEKKLSGDAQLGSVKWKEMIPLAWRISPKIAVQLVKRFRHGQAKSELERLIRGSPEASMHVPEALEYFLTEEAVRENASQLRYLIYWAPVSPPQAIVYLGRRYLHHPLVVQYALRVLRGCSADTVIYYLPQIVQQLRNDTSGHIEEFLLHWAKRSQLVAHQMIWNLQTYMGDENDPLLKDSLSGEIDPENTTLMLAHRCSVLRDRIITSFDSARFLNFKQEFEFFSRITDISGVLLAYDDPVDRRAVLEEELRRCTVRGQLYLPSNPDTTVFCINPSKSAPMQSATRVPILVTFMVNDHAAIEGDLDDPREAELDVFEEEAPLGESVPSMPHPDPGGSFTILPPASAMRRTSASHVQMQPLQPQEDQHWQACIFKVNDDVRQDMLALQIIGLCKRIFQNVGLDDLFLFPYRVVATGHNRGIIECVPNARSRDQLGKQMDGSLEEYFYQAYGPPSSLEFQRARRNFVQSMAAYSLVSYILQVKDRHNGNIMIDDDGHIIHIDFGFIFDISPGGDLRFERAPFKVSEEMLALLGANPNSEQWKLFMSSCVKAYLAVRDYASALEGLVEPMLDTGLDCFKENTLANLRTRLSTGKSEMGAGNHMAVTVIESISAFSHFTTVLYDKFQAYSNGIEY